MVFLTALFAFAATLIGIYEKKEGGRRLTGWAIAALVVAILSLLMAWYQACAEQDRQAVVAPFAQTELRRTLHGLASPFGMSIVTVNGGQPLPFKPESLKAWRDPAQRAKLADIEKFNEVLRRGTPVGVPNWADLFCSASRGGDKRLLDLFTGYQAALDAEVLKQIRSIREDPIWSNFVRCLKPADGMQTMLSPSGTVLLVERFIKLDDTLNRVQEQPKPWWCFWWSWFHKE